MYTYEKCPSILEMQGSPESGWDSPVLWMYLDIKSLIEGTLGT